jgi:hypothetical protein
MVGRDGVEPSTSRLSGVRSNHLSYRPQSLKTTEPGPQACRKISFGRDVQTAGGHMLSPDNKIIRILRKEVIQPQVPLRLPCYDFTPVADPTVAGCLPCGLTHRLKVEPTPMV